MNARIHLIACAGLLLASSSALAQFHYVEYGVNVSLGWNGYIEHYEQGAEPVGLINEELVEEGYGRVACQANVGFGVNKARVDLAGTNPENPLYFEYGFASSRYFDSFQFDDPELNGQHGFFEVTLYVDGSGDVAISDEYRTHPDTEFYSFWHAVINVSVDGVETPTGPIQSVYYAGEWYKGFDETDMVYFGDPLNTYQQTATIEFIYGQPILMDTFLQVLTQFDNQYAGAAGTIDSVIDLGNSSYWGGISNLRDASGNPVTDAAYTSSSGFDYRIPAVPVIVPGDLTDDGATNLPDGVVNVFDLFMLLGNWNSSGAGADVAAPFDVVDVFDLFVLLANWG